MAKAADYRTVMVGRWRLVVCPSEWTEELQKRVVTLVDSRPRSKHPQTIELNRTTKTGIDLYYLKVFAGGGGFTALKDFCRASKAFRFWRQGLALSAAGFNSPPTIAAGELRHFGMLQRAFVVTSKIDGQLLPAYLAHLGKASDRRASMKEKRAGIILLAHLIREFHRQGFIHGDLVATNLLIAGSTADGLSVWFMDNDRTMRLPKWLFRSLRNRNLIQLNRMPLPGITLQDRMRFLHAFLGRQKLTHRDRVFARGIEKKTRRRRKECDGADPTIDFRQLMRWKGTSI